ncbi:hypothetical protein BL954_004826, partial [Escherichia coli]|nr:hypothetical protein [Escherichia coli]
QALQPIIDDGRAKSISVTAEHRQKGWMLLHIIVTSASGTPQTWKFPVKVS